MKNRGKFLAWTAVLAGVYFVATVSLAPMVYGPIQLRVSEILTLLAFFNPAFVPGLVIGCFLSNLLSPYGVLDMAAGTLATLLAVYPMARCKNIYLASLLPVLSNGLIIGSMIAWLSNIPWFSAMLMVGGSEFVTVSILGVLVVKGVERVYPLEKLRHAL